MEIMSEKSQVKNYFATKAGDYDAVDQQRYWMLSDGLLWWLLEEQVISGLPPNFRFLDAGAGTGRWASKVLDARPDAHGDLVDLSPEMLSEARRKLETSAEGRFSCAVEDLDSFEPTEEYDLVICLHNVIGFVDSPEQVAAKLFSALKPGGTFVLATPNFYHALYFGLANGDVALTEQIANTRKAWFNRDMPGMHSFTPRELSGLLQEAGESKVLGFPITIYPGMEETQLFGETDALVSLFDGSEASEFVSELERKLILDESAAARGNQLLLLVRKP